MMRRSNLPVLLSGLLALVSFVSCAQTSPSGPDPSASPAAGGHSAHAPVAGATPRIPDFRAKVDDKKALPQTLDPSRFSTPYIVRAYRIAKEAPEVLAQQPCYCYCDAGFGHGSLLDCHIDDHSAGCAVCIKEVFLAERLHREGKNAIDIRDAIVRGEWRSVELK